MFDRPWFLFFAPVIMVAMEVVVLSELLRRDHWEIFEVAPVGIAVAVLLALGCSARLSILRTRDVKPTPWGKRTLIGVACFSAQFALSCGVGTLLFRG